MAPSVRCRARRVNGDGLDAMLAALGGHGEGGARWTEGMAGLGCRRLSASATGKDRVEAALCFDRDAGLVLAADAGRRPRGVLRRARRVRRGTLRPDTDGDLILRVWTRWGRDCPNHLLGDYSLCRMGRAPPSAVLRLGPRLRAVLLLRPDAGPLHLRQLGGSGPRRAGSLLRAGRSHGGGVPDQNRLLVARPHVLPGIAQAAPRLCAHGRGRTRRGWTGTGARNRRRRPGRPRTQSTRKRSWTFSRGR